jgi:hypothetical protein
MVTDSNFVVGLTQRSTYTVHRDRRISLLGEFRIKQIFTVDKFVIKWITTADEKHAFSRSLVGEPFWRKEQFCDLLRGRSPLS